VQPEAPGREGATEEMAREMAREMAIERAIERATESLRGYGSGRRISTRPRI
jgi:hypothetical protein